MFAGGGTSSSGVISRRPKGEPKDSPWKFKETVLIGETSFTRDQVRGIITEIKKDYPANSYHLTSR